MTTSAPSNAERKKQVHASRRLAQARCRRVHGEPRRGDHPQLGLNTPQVSRTLQASQSPNAMLTLNASATTRRPASRVLKARMVLSGQGPRHGANATGGLGQTKRNKPAGGPMPSQRLLSPAVTGILAPSAVSLGSRSSDTSTHREPRGTRVAPEADQPRVGRSPRVSREDPLQPRWSSGSRGAATWPGAPNGDPQSCRAPHTLLAPAPPRSPSLSSPTEWATSRAGHTAHEVQATSRFDR
jgi:hypothetical protein